MHLIHPYMHPPVSQWEQLIPADLPVKQLQQKLIEARLNKNTINHNRTWLHISQLALVLRPKQLEDRPTHFALTSEGGGSYFRAVSLYFHLQIKLWGQGCEILPSVGLVDAVFCPILAH